MHDIDRTNLETDPEYDAFETDSFEADSFEFADESGFGGNEETYSPFNEVEEMELAEELLQIASEEELDQFLGKLIKGAWRGIRKAGKFVGKVARPLSGVLKIVAKKALPFVGGALGSIIPGAGTAIGSMLGGALSKALEMEFDGMSQEDQEFEMARRFVRVAGTAARQAALANPNADPHAAVKAAVMASARQHIPGLDKAIGAAPASGARANRGRWIRRGNKIIILGV